MKLIQLVGTHRRYTRQLQQHFHAGERIEAYTAGMFRGGSGTALTLICATDRALYVPAISGDLVFPYERMTQLSWLPEGSSGRGTLTFAVPGTAPMIYACNAPKAFGPYIQKQRAGLQEG